ncbi:hypothetical protein ELOC111193_05645 [Elizabethkingia occulta]|uniref:Uncharacterized protein n=1 Tax=Elizabethkingia occulta TaxID=1867263 RepID=A0A1T3MSF2_9FLAO|nr:hypothetical protein [Elizabethkingia occulta]OPB87724.1 hypothetical protein BB020_03845 [Elizabethkingia occulta]OPC67535.1 hypothetical protein BAZ10_15900 [Elizabethkingia occulta]
MKKLNRSLLKHVSGGIRIAYADCMDGDHCPPPPTSGKTGFCDGGVCYYETGGTTNPGGGCTEPARDCMPWETGCGCVY